MSPKRVISNNNILIIIYFLMLITSNLYAYIDPGSTSILLQLLIAGIAGGLAVFKRYVALFFRYLVKISKIISKNN